VGRSPPLFALEERDEDVGEDADEVEGDEDHD
jgi:hypothetical protein